MKLVQWFLLITFFITYASHGLLIYLLNHHNLVFDSGIGQLLFITGGSAPTIVAFLCIHKLGSQTGKATFYSQLKSFKQPLNFIMFALFAPLALTMMHVMFALVGGFSLDEAPLLPLYFVYLLPSIIFGGLEEIGWRGIVQNHMKQFMSLFPLTIILGVVWALWHLPMFFIDALPHSDNAFLPFLLQGIVFSMYLGWLFAKTKSLPLVIVFHAGINAAMSAGYYVGLTHRLSTYLYIAVAFMVATVLIISYEKTAAIASDDA